VYFRAQTAHEPCSAVYFRAQTAHEPCSAVYFRATLRSSGLQQFDADEVLRPMQSVRRQGVGLPLRRHILRRMQGAYSVCFYSRCPEI
jgi:hypothetical protein